MVKIVATTFFLLVVCAPLLAQPNGRLAPPRTAEPINLDGRLDEAAWQTAEPYTTFIQCLPAIGEAPTERTELRILYDDNNLYLALTAFDSAPERIIATGLERDVFYSSDDHFEVIIDTYNDKRQGILFSTNALSARFDEEVLDNGSGFNAAYNTFWDVRSRRHESGFTSEFQIPFSSLRFQPAEEVVMGLKVVRYIKHKNEFDMFPATDVTVSNAVWRVNNTIDVVFTNLRSRRPFYLIPYARASFEEGKTWDPNANRLARSRELMHGNGFSTNQPADKLLSNLGVDVKYGLSKNFTLDATLNTDFAQAEADNRILNFTRFAINLPEKRNFFLESKDYLSFATGSGILLFNSRAIGIESGYVVPIVGGVRVSGKANGLQLGLLDLQTHGMGEQLIHPQHFSVLRLRKDAWNNGSYVGGIFTNRISTRGGSLNNQAVGVDAVKRFSNNRWLAGGALAATNDKGSGYLDQGMMASANLSLLVTLGYNHSSLLEYCGRYFKPLSGFAADSAYVLANFINGYTWQWKDSETLNLYWINHSLQYKYRTVNSTHESVYTELELGNSFKSGATTVVTPYAAREYLPYNWNFRPGIEISSGYYTLSGLRTRYDSRQTGQLNYSVALQAGSFYSGSRFNLLLSGYYAINKNFRLTYRYDFNHFQFPVHFSSTGEAGFQSNLVTAGLSYTSSIYFSIRALVQYDDVSKTIGSNFRIRFNPREGTDLFIVYNPRLNTSFYTPEAGRTATIDQQLFIIKFSRAFAL